jgi:predicted nucleic acid-binding Zn ribbon protein
MTRRRLPRPAGLALAAALDRAAPATPLARAQAVWPTAVGEQIAAVAEPRSERDGVLTVTCADSTWAQELDLMQEDLLGRLREMLGEGAPRGLRFDVGRGG